MIVLCFLQTTFIACVASVASVSVQFRRKERGTSNLVPRVFSLSNMAAAGEKTLAHSELKRSLIGAFHCAIIRSLSLVYSFQNKNGGSLGSSWKLRTVSEA